VTVTLAVGRRPVGGFLGEERVENGKEGSPDPGRRRDRECGVSCVGGELQGGDDDILRLGLIEVGRGGRRRLVDDIALAHLRHAACGQGSCVQGRLRLRADVVDAPEVDRQADADRQGDDKQAEQHGDVAGLVAAQPPEQREHLEPVRKHVSPPQ